jgi:anti-anti-sigma factor
VNELAMQTMESVAQVSPGAGSGQPMIMVLEGEVRREDAGEIAAHLARLAASGLTRLVVDFEDVRHFDFRGVRTLVRQAEDLRAMGGDLVLAGLSPYLHAIFRSAGANDVFDFFADAQEALASFHRPTPPLRE